MDKNKTSFPVITIGFDDVEEWLDEETQKKITPEILEKIAKVMGTDLDWNYYEAIKKSFYIAVDEVLDN